MCMQPLRLQKSGAQYVWTIGRLDLLTMPSVIFTDRQVANVGFTEQQATDLGFKVESCRLGIEMFRDHWLTLIPMVI